VSQEGKIWDIIIAGGGPAGLTAAIYGSRAGHSVLVLEKMLLGGEIVSTNHVDNYPGFPEGISGPELGQLMEKQASRFGTEIISREVKETHLEENPVRLETAKDTLYARKLIIASGTVPRSLGIPGEERLKGKGISYCASCDAAFYRGKEVAVIGGGDAAVEEAVFLTRFAEKVYLIHRRHQLRAVKSLQEQLFNHPKIEFLRDTVAQEIKGENQVEGLELNDQEKTYHLPVQGFFIYIGRLPQTDAVKGQLETDENGYIVTDEEMRTSRAGVLAAGDVRHKIFRQVSTAVGDGATAAYTASRELQMP